MTELRSPFRHPPGSFRELWAVAIPLVLSSGSLSLMHVVDRVFLTWYSTDALAAAMPASMLHWTLISVTLGTVSYVNTFVAQYVGAGRPDRAAAAVWQGCYLSLFCGLLFLGVVSFTEPIFALVGHAEAVQRLECQYFSVFCIGSAPVILSVCLSCHFSGRGDTKTVMWVNFAAVVVNGLLAWCLIFGKWGLPALGIAGAAWATVTAHVVSVAIYLAVLARPRERENGFWRNRAFDKELFGRLIRYGLPTGFQYLVEIGGFAVFILLLGTVGKDELAATSLAFNLNTLTFIPMLGIGTAVMTLVGLRIGEGRPELAARTTWLAFGLTSTYMAGFAAIYILLPDYILSAYAAHSKVDDFEQIRGLVTMLLRFVAFYSFFDAMAIIFGSAVRGAGDTRFSLIFIAVGAWTLMVLPTAVGCLYTDNGLMIGWTACSFYVLVNGVGFLLRFLQGRWKSMRVIEEHPAESSPVELRPHIAQTSTSDSVDEPAETIATSS